MERETGIEPATNSLEGCDSTTELLPPTRRPLRLIGASGRPANHVSNSAAALAAPYRRSFAPLRIVRLAPAKPVQLKPTRRMRVRKAGGEGRTRTFEGARPTDLQSAAFDRFATSPMRCLD